jgi:Ca2+-binding RTX toxin-like protein
MLSRSRATLLATVVVVAGLAFGASAASASIVVGVDGPSLLIVSQGSGPNGTSVSFEDPAIVVSNQQGADLDSSGSAACTQDSQYTISCDAAGFSDLQTQYGAANDDISVAACFSTATIDLGEGTNSYQGPGCADPVVFTVLGGAGQDNFSGSGYGGTHTVERLYGGGGDDSLYGGAGDDLLYGGDGADTLSGAADNDQLYGEGGNDIIRGADGNDIEDGGPGDDQIGFSAGVSDDDDQGADQLTGGPGTDKLLLDAHTGGVSISLDGVANDGSPGEGDNVASDFEAIDGTTANDVFVGSPGPDQFSGNAGNDDIHGGGGNDSLYGSSGDDHVSGDAGNDKVEGANGADTVDGGPGQDQIYGDIGSCSFSCSFDADLLLARDGERDAVDCGGGADTAQVDTLDVVAFCASVDRQGTGNTGGAGAGPGSGGGGGGGTSAAAALGLKVAGTVRAKALLAHGLALRLTCAGACKIAADLRLGAKKLGTARKTRLSAGKATLTVKISGKAAKRAVRKVKRAKLTLRVKVTDANGKVTPVKRTIVLKR